MHNTIVFYTFYTTLITSKSLGVLLWYCIISDTSFVQVETAIFNKPSFDPLTKLWWNILRLFWPSVVTQWPWPSKFCLGHCLQIINDNCFIFSRHINLPWDLYVLQIILTFWPLTLIFLSGRLLGSETGHINLTWDLCTVMSFGPFANWSGIYYLHLENRVLTISRNLHVTTCSYFQSKSVLDQKCALYGYFYLWTSNLAIMTFTLSLVIRVCKVTTHQQHF